MIWYTSIRFSIPLKLRFIPRRFAHFPLGSPNKLRQQGIQPRVVWVLRDAKLRLDGLPKICPGVGHLDQESSQRIRS